MGIFTDLIEFKLELENHSDDLSLEGTSIVKGLRKQKWKKAKCDKHVVLVHPNVASPVCKVCSLNEKIQNLALIGIKVKSGLDVYNFEVVLKCGHFKVDSYFNLVKNPFCGQCRDDRLLQKYHEYGVEVLHLGSATEKTTLIFKCGHIAQRKTYSEDKPVCLECKNIKITNTLNETGATKVSNGFILKCGHLAKTDVYERLKNYLCLHCRNEEQISKFEKKGLKFISNNGVSARVYKLPCGHTKSLRATQSDKNIICAICNETYYNKPSDLYLLILFTETGTYLKLGMSNDLFERIDNYKLSNTRVMVLSQVQIDTAARCVNIEKALHKKYKKFRIDPMVMKQHMDCGFTECYDILIMDKLQGELNIIRKEPYADYTRRYKNNE